ncbi:MAG: penicillin-binding protein 1A [Acidobacteriota bacterium]
MIPLKYLWRRILSAAALLISRWRLIVLVLSLAILITLAGVLLYGFIRFKPLLDERLQKQPHTNAVYSRPFKISLGDRLSLKELRQELAESGYESEKNRGEGSDWYQVLRGGVRLHQTENGKPQTLVIRLDNGAVQSLQRGRVMVREISLKPRFLSNLFGNSREKRKYVRYRDFPDQLIKAVLAAEDENFFEHHGLDLPSLARAAFVNIRGLKPRSSWQGGSTITQQFIKNYFLTPKKSMRRKLEEAYLALLVESRFSKQQIFEFYANEVYMGQAGSFSMIGLAQAADGYLGKQLRDLSTAECALLAGMIQAPNRYSPFADRRAATRRRNYVLERMVQDRFLTSSQAEASSLEPLKTVSSTRHLYTEAPYFIDYLSEAMTREVPDWRKTENFEVFSTLDPELQEAAVEAVRAGTARVDRQLRNRKGVRPEVALIAVDPRNGDVLAMIGGRNYRQSQFNRAVQALRQPGSAFKPFVYATALQSGGYTLGSIVLDAPYQIDFGDEHYEPTNFGGGYRGNVTLRRALALSLNVPTVKIAEKVGYQAVAQFSHSLGFSDRLQGYPSLALGTWEVSLLDLTQAYTAFANQGRVVRLRGMTAYTKNGKQYEVPVVSRQVISPEVAYLITSTLESAVNWGTAAGVRGQGFRLPVAGKTGSSNDSWFAGYAPDMLCVVWVGYDDFSDIHLLGADAAMPVWVEFMKRAERLGKLSGATFQIPKDIVTRYIDTTTGLLATFNCPNTQPEQFIAGTEPTETCYLNHYDEFQGEPDEELIEGQIRPEGEQKKGFWDFLKILGP